MINYLDNIIFSANNIAPVFIIVAIGIFLRYKKLINEDFVNLSSKIVFNVTLPVLIFMKLSQIDLSQNFDWKQIAFIYAGTITFYVLVWIVSQRFIKDGRELGAFVQGTMRSNFAIVGFAIIFNIYGNEGLAFGAILLSFIMPLYNVLSIFVLTVTANNKKSVSYLKILVEFFKNPLIISVIISIPFSYLNIKIPIVFTTTGNYLSALTLPLALLGIGGGLSIHNFRKTSNLAIIASVLRIVIIPATLTLLAYYIGYKGMTLGILFILFACPTAIVSYIMAKAMNSDSELAGNIIVISTLGSVLTMSMGLFILKSMNLI